MLKRGRVCLAYLADSLFRFWELSLPSRVASQLQSKGHVLLWCLILHWEEEEKKKKTVANNFVYYAFSHIFIDFPSPHTYWIALLHMGYDNPYPISINKYSHYTLCLQMFRCNLVQEITSKHSPSNFTFRKKGRYFRISKPIILRCQRHVYWEKELSINCSIEYCLYGKLTFLPSLPCVENNFLQVLLEMLASELEEPLQPSESNVLPRRGTCSSETFYNGNSG